MSLLLFYKVLNNEPEIDTLKSPKWLHTYSILFSACVFLSHLKSITNSNRLNFFTNPGRYLITKKNTLSLSFFLETDIHVNQCFW